MGGKFHKPGSAHRSGCGWQAPAQGKLETAKNPNVMLGWRSFAFLMLCHISAYRPPRADLGARLAPFWIADPNQPEPIN